MIIARDGIFQLQEFILPQLFLLLDYVNTTVTAKPFQGKHIFGLTRQ